MSFKKNRYIVIKNAISKELADFSFNYFMLKRNTVEIMKKEGYISRWNVDWGYWDDEQCPNTYSHYGDLVMETLLQKVKPIMEEKTKLKLIPTYSYARIYKKGDILKRHKDRESCEISTTLNLGGDPWPIYVEPDPSKGKTVEGLGYVSDNTKGKKINLLPGDMLVYSGCDLEHWRDEFKGDHCAQVFLHYNNLDGKFATSNIYDSRPFLGLPSWFKK